MCITYLSYITWSLPKLHVLNKYHHQNRFMCSYVSKGFIDKSRNVFWYVTENEREVDILVWNKDLVI